MNTIETVLAIARSNGIPDIKSLAEKMGVSRPQLSRWIHRRQSPSLDNFLKICEAAGAEVVVRQKNKS